MPVLQGEAIHTAETIQETIPDLMVEYHAEQISLYGVTGTPEELIKYCPVPHDQMTIEAKNMFLVMAMNESKTEISEKHLPYFQKITESRGVELNVTVRIETEAPVEVESKELKTQEKIAIVQTTVEPIKAPHREPVHERPFKIHQPAKDIPTTNLHDYKITENYDKEPLIRDVDETTTDRMDAWLTQIQHEYEIRFPNLKINDKSLDDADMSKPDISKQGYANEQTYDPASPSPIKPEAPVNIQEKMITEPVSVEADEAIMSGPEIDSNEPGQDNVAPIITEDSAEIPTIKEALTINRFVEFLASQPISSALPSLEAVQEVAGQLPVEETLVRMAAIIETTPLESTAELRELIVVTCEIIAECIELSDANEPVLTPEAIEKIIELLHHIGYKHAEEALESYLMRHDIEFLAQALRHLHLLSSQDINPEFWQFFTNNKYYVLPGKSRLGKMLLQLIGVHQLHLTNTQH
ncbi:hypothetical protein H0X10_03230 [Candidatus Saccharibacteria bacterium]|nr:hypothetical protein [Candidatus Saccharibacteria bacterium]